MENQLHGLPADDRGAPGRPEDEGELLLIGRIGERAFALALAEVERILPMAALSAVPDAEDDVVGVLNLHGTVLPVVDPRPRLRVAPAQPSPEQYLLVVTVGGDRYLLWVDGVEQITPCDDATLPDSARQPASSLARSVVKLDGQVIPVLSGEALAPRAGRRATGVGAA